MERISFVISSGMGAGIWRDREAMPFFPLPPLTGIPLAGIALLTPPFTPPLVPPLPPRKYFSSKVRNSCQETGISQTETVTFLP